VTPAIASPIRPAREPEWPVWALVLAMLAVGLVARTAVVNRTVPATVAGVTIAVPAAWSELEALSPEELLRIGEPFGSTQFPVTVRVAEFAAGGDSQSLADAGLALSVRQTDILLGHRVLGMEPARLAGQEAVAMDYAYVAEPELGAAAALPEVMRGRDYIVRAGDRVLLVGYSAPAARFAEAEAAWARIARTLRIE